MSDIRHKAPKPAILFGAKTVKRVGYIDDYIFACEIKGEDHIIYKKPRKPKYHLVIIVLAGKMEILVNGQWFTFVRHTYANLGTWADIYEIRYTKDFHAMVSATDKTVISDIFRNRNPFPMSFRSSIDHAIGGDILEDKDIEILRRDISNMIASLSNKEHKFAEEINYAYFYIMLTDMADMMWRRYGEGVPSHRSEMKRSDKIMKDFADLLAENISTETEVSFYAEKLCISKQYLSIIVKDRMKVTIGTVIASLRVEKAATLLRDPELTIQQIAEKMNFSDQSSFGKFFKKRTGMSPLQYRSNLRKTLLTLRPESTWKGSSRNE